MKRPLTRFVRCVISMWCLASMPHAASAQLTLQECLEKAHDNYPLIAKYSLLERTAAIDISDINKAWLPQVNAGVQATVQNVVPAFPDALSDVMAKMGQEMQGLGRFQYKASVEVSQNIWDGGAAAAQKAVAHAGEISSRASVDVRMYAVRERVENIFFGILLLQEQIGQTQTTANLIDSNAERMQRMVSGGTAMPTDVDMLKAQALTLRQQIAQATHALDAYRKMLELYIGEPLDGKSLVCPDLAMPDALVPDNRPEMAMYEARIMLNREMMKNVSASLMPKIGVFAQAYYGYPGLDYFKSMRTRDASFNIVAGLKVSWSVSPFYTRRNRMAKLALDSDDIRIEREQFLFDTQLQTQSRMDEIDGLREIMATDSEIVDLRMKVRRVAESQLENGVIDPTALLTKITDESMARLTAKYHEIQLLESIYKLKQILNR